MKRKQMMSLLLAGVLSASMLVGCGGGSNISIPSLQKESSEKEDTEEKEEKEEKEKKEQEEVKTEEVTKEEEIIVEPEEEKSETDDEKPSGTVKDLSEVSSYEDIKVIVDNDIALTMEALYADFEEIKGIIPDYKSYIAHKDLVDAFYKEITDTNKLLCLKAEYYATIYARFVLANEKSDDVYDKIDIIYDDIYDGVIDDIYDEIYGGIIDEVYDYFYDGVIDDGYDLANYSEWFESSTEEYGNWMSAGTKVYSDWMAAGSEVYSFWMSLGTSTFMGVSDSAWDTIDKFEKDVLEEIKELSEE
ncbi:MAG: hypothetical protein MJ105_06690 [Lachnospiraceae bacterium]|nr:hypothetical protein [Lachnospiraceae bacterium]